MSFITTPGILLVVYLVVVGGYLLRRGGTCVGEGRRPQTPWQRHLAVERHAAQRCDDLEEERLRLEREVWRHLAELDMEMDLERLRRRGHGGQA